MQVRAENNVDIPDIIPEKLAVTECPSTDTEIEDDNQKPKSIILSTNSPSPTIKTTPNTDYLHRNLLFVSTLNGQLHCLDIRTGKILWSRADINSRPLTMYGEPIADNKDIFKYDGLIFPNAQNGEIFIVDKHIDTNNLHSNDYTIRPPSCSIQSLVEQCPILNFNAGTRLSSKKEDTILELDMKTGKELPFNNDSKKKGPICSEEATFESVDPEDADFENYHAHHFDDNFDNLHGVDLDYDDRVITVGNEENNTGLVVRRSPDFMESDNIILLSKTDYILENKALKDTAYFGKNYEKSETVWNITYSEYTTLKNLETATSSPNFYPENFPQKYFYSDKYLLAADIKSEQPLWDTQFNSNIISMFTWSKKYGSMMKVPEEALAFNTYMNLIRQRGRNGKITTSINSLGEKMINGMKIQEAVKFDLMPIQHGSSMLGSMRMYAHISQCAPNEMQPMKFKAELPAIDHQLDEPESFADLPPAVIMPGWDLFTWTPGFYELPKQNCKCYISKMKCLHQETSKECVPDEDSAEFEDYVYIQEAVKNNRLNYREKLKEKERENRKKALKNYWNRKNKEEIAGPGEKKRTFIELIILLIFTPDMLIEDGNKFLAATFIVICLIIIRMTYKSISSTAFQKPRSDSFDSSRFVTKNNKDFKIIGDVVIPLPKKILGAGSLGTKVFQGKFQERECAVKRILYDNTELAQKEIDLLQKNDHHRNVIRYYASAADHEFLYIALELCECTLSDYIENNYDHKWRNSGKDGNGRLEITDALYQTIEGVTHLHNAGVVHRDIKPSNILRWVLGIIWLKN